jgi:YrbI family 3-deoxy-D-manno-octulosonate 8-phosphate phosphatase
MMKLQLDQLDAIVFDFDGVLTDNRVWIDQDGRESICCNRSDGLAFDVLRTRKTKLFILSTENNKVVTQRAKKLQIPVFQGVREKRKSLEMISQQEAISLKKTMFVGNDLNDYNAMAICGHSACPADSHKKIIELAKIVLKTKGGEGIVRELVEGIFEIDILKAISS